MKTKPISAMLVFALLILIVLSSALVSCGDKKDDAENTDSADAKTETNAESDIQVINPDTDNVDPDNTDTAVSDTETEISTADTEINTTNTEKDTSNEVTTAQNEKNTEKESDVTTSPAETEKNDKNNNKDKDTENTSSVTTEDTTSPVKEPDTEPITTDTSPIEDPKTDTQPEREVVSLKYVALGDSIAQGYGLTNFSSERYSSLLGSYIDDLEYYDCKTYNYAVSGDDSQKLISVLKSGTAVELENADIVTISIGANNILGVSVEKLSQYYIFSMIRDETLRKAKLQQIYDELQTSTENGIQTFINDIPTIISLIKKSAPNARIIFQTVYNPFKSMDLTFDDFGDTPFTLSEETDRLVIRLNDAIYAATKSSGYEVCDIYSVFAKETGVVNCELYEINYNDIMSSMMAVDPHPTSKGHTLIADTIFAQLALK